MVEEIPNIQKLQQNMNRESVHDVTYPHPLRQTFPHGTSLLNS
jgi:hypothetical protein